MIAMNVRKVAEITGGHLVHNGASVELRGISTDSRTLQPGDLFVPLRGERFDGHDYLSQAIENGAAACLCEEMIGALPVPLVKVNDTLKALGDLANAVRRGFAGLLIGITGTSGKTTCKEMLAGILGALGPGLKTSANFNNLIGVPLTLFGLESEHRWAVVEMGMSERGEIARLCEIAAPQIGLITNVGAGHLQNFDDTAGIARAKGELFIDLPADGVALVNADDELIRNLPVANGVRRVLFGTAADAEVRAERVRLVDGRPAFDLVIAGRSRSIVLPLPGRHNVLNALAAAAAAAVLGLEPETIGTGLEAFRPLPGRMELVELSDGVIILEDSYNANPLSMRAALDALHDIEVPGKRIAVLGDMLELGPSAADLHRRVGELVAGRADLLLTLGELAEGIAEGALDAGLPAERVVSAVDREILTERLLGEIRPGDGVLIKGSRGMRMETFTAALRADRAPRAANGN
jgi:UDP-N-acetylmuramoyl-tripeptide--D-alanyl-D-alanine ligase